MTSPSTMFAMTLSTSVRARFSWESAQPHVERARMITVADAKRNLWSAKAAVEHAQAKFHQALTQYDAWPTRVLRLFGGGSSQRRRLDRARHQFLKAQDAIVEAREAMLLAWNNTRPT